jgi:hypothetical protein
VLAAGGLVAFTEPDERARSVSIQVLHKRSGADVPGQEVRRGVGAALHEQAEFAEVEQSSGGVRAMNRATGDEDHALLTRT